MCSLLFSTKLVEGVKVLLIIIIYYALNSFVCSTFLTHLMKKLVKIKIAVAKVKGFDWHSTSI